MEAQLLLVAAVAGVGILHTIVPDHWRLIGTPGVVFRPLSPRSTQRLRISACWHRDETSPVVHDFLRIARARGGTGACEWLR